MACHNRKEKTLACLRALRVAERVAQQVCDVYLVDDGSVDGTSDAVTREYPRVRIFQGDGNLFWNRSMYWAFGEALRKRYEFYLWLNDDTLLHTQALKRLLACHDRVAHEAGRGGIIVGSTRDHASGKLTYGGVVRPSPWKPLTFQRLAPPLYRPVQCDTMNGNVALIPDSVASKVGNFEPRFVHAMGDTDYGLRAKKAGFENWVMPGFAGLCSNNPPDGTYTDPNIPLRERLKKMAGPKGLPLKSWLIFTRRHAGPFWILFWLWPYAKILITSLVRR